MNANRVYDLLATALVVVMAAVLTWMPLYERVDALSTDWLLYLRHLSFGQQYPAAQSPTVVVAIDELTYRTEPFAKRPKVLWTPYVAKVQDAILAADARVFGYDVIFSTSLEADLPGYERPFLRSLLMAARQGKVVLGKAQHGQNPVSPHAAQSMVVRNQQNIRSLNMITDRDDVIRRIPLFFDTRTGVREPSMPLELAARFFGASPRVEADQSVTFRERRIPGSADNSAYINFQGGADIPTYSLADLYACAQAGDQAYFRRHFKGKVVLLGGVLDVEDRKLTSKRLMAGSGAGHGAKPCRAQDEPMPPAYRRDSIPGVYVLASATNDLIRGNSLAKLSRHQASLLLALGAALVAWLSIALRPAFSALAVGLLAAVCLMAGLLAIHAELLTPLAPLWAVIALSYAVMLLYRYTVSDQQKKQIRSLFGLYLEPRIVSSMLESGRLPVLGGESREVTVWFSDLADFTQLSEGLQAEELVALMNRYFSLVTDVIELHSGFVDKYIGDAVLAVFGAPHDDPHHAGHAVAAALTVRERLAELNAAGEFGSREIKMRTGINTGMAVVGNVGSSRRFNYTVMGDTVNLAARLEGANKMMGTRILISAETAGKLPESILLREIAALQVKGKQTPTCVFEPLATLARRVVSRDVEACRSGKGQQRALQQPEPETPEKLDWARRQSRLFGDAHRAFRDGQFHQVLALLEPHKDDPAVLAMMQRAAQMLDKPLPDPWDGVVVLTEK
jgi:adenylate cyclase